MITADDLMIAPIFAPLSSQEREHIAKHAAELFFKKGDWVVREGEAPWFFILLEGRLHVEKEYGASSRTELVYSPGDFHGETPIILNSVVVESLRADVPSRVARLDRSQCLDLIASSSACRDLVFQVMMTRVTRMQMRAKEVVGIRVTICASLFDAQSRQVRSFLSMNHIPFELRTEFNADALPFREKPPLNSAFAIIDGKTLVAPLTVRKVAEALGMPITPSRDLYDVVVIGAGPAGLAAAVCGASEGLSVLLLDRSAPGGQAGTSSRIENYPGFPTGISGDDLTTRFLKQATRFGTELVLSRAVTTIERHDDGYRLLLDDAEAVVGRTVVLATGVEWRKISATNIDQFLGKGVLYGATRMEASAVTGKKVFIVGGGNSAGQAAMFFSAYAYRVTLLIRGAGLHATMSQYLIDQIEARRNIKIGARTEVVSVGGQEFLESLETVTKGEQPLRRPANALFVMIGAEARTGWLPSDLERDVDGFVYTGRNVKHQQSEQPPFLLETSLPGLFCAGDVRHSSIKRVSSSAGEGSMTIAFVHQHLARRL